jgi:hypothetical protein
MPEPETTSADNLFLLANTDRAKAATATDRQSAFDSLLRIENPARETPDTIDCASCHVARTAREFTVDAMGLSAAGNQFAFVADSGIPAQDLMQATIVQDGDPNPRSLGYDYVTPVISQRVINETAANLDYLRRQ